MTTSSLLADQLRRTREWTLLLIEDISGDEWTFQPGPGLPHALWICGHMVSAQNTLLFERCLDSSILDADFAAHFPLGGPIKSAAEHDWPGHEVVRRKMDEMQRASEQAILKLSDVFLAEPAFGKDGAKHPHYDNKLEAVSHMARHEAFHAGQLSTLRRLLGKAFLR